MNRSTRRDLYRRCVLSGIPRALTEMDRDPFSVTYGSFDREYWAWATKDFSNIDLQRAIYPLTLIYLNDFEGNVWYREPRVKDWIIAGVRYWGKVQHRDGSFDHHYPNEHSFVGIAFTLYEISQAFLDLDKASMLESEERAIWLSIMIKATNFLCKNGELHGFISNHRAGAACALFVMYLITGDDAYKKRAYFFINTIEKRMSQNEGWLCEYNGADPGYQTLDTYYLANFYQLSNDEKVLQEVIIPSIKFLIYFFHPDGSVGGEYGSRNCPLYFPSGFEILATVIPEAETIAQTGAFAVSKGNSPSLTDHDIRNFIPMLSCYTQALVVSLGEKSSESTQMPFEREFERYWPEAGLYVRSDKRMYVIVGCSKGGVIKVFDKVGKRLIASHGGYMVEQKNGKLYSTQFLNRPICEIPFYYTKGEVELKEEQKLSFEFSFFLVVVSRVMTPLRFLFFRLFNLTFGRIHWLNNWIRRSVITGIFIHRKVKSNFCLVRNMIFSKDEIEVKDSFHGLKLKHFKSIRASDIFTTIYMGSSKYYRHAEKLEDKLSKVDLFRYLKEDKLIVSYKIDVSGIREVTT
ncbi:MAG TPA: hypothetical protein ACFYD7_12025 [Candidatus Wujingus californicus]|uniref:hypothetical protein n=1 Tax=Candidatus Wujingus californicus TaxID=3367618 RepID=UPI004029F43B